MSRNRQETPYSTLARRNTKTKLDEGGTFIQKRGGAKKWRNKQPEGKSEREGGQTIEGCRSKMRNGGGKIKGFTVKEGRTDY